MSEVPPDDWQRWQDEIQRCHLLSAQVEMVTPYRPPRQTRDARYYTERGRVLSAVGPERAVAFLREEALRALAGTLRDGAMTRWLRLHTLEHGDGIDTVIDVMNAGVKKAVREGAADIIAERNRAARAEREAHRRTLSCDWCLNQGGCTGACY